MMGKTHRLAGLSAGILVGSKLIVSPYTPEQFIIAGAFMGACTVGSLLPDIDHQNSLISKKMKLTSKIVSSLFEHRGVTHAPLIHAFILGILYLTINIYLSEYVFVSYICKALLSGLYLGILTHIILDLLTIKGVPLLFPLTSINVKQHLLPLKTGKYERFIRVLIATFTIGGLILWK